MFRKVGKGGGPAGSSDEEEGWESMQIRKAITGQKVGQSVKSLRIRFFMYLSTIYSIIIFALRPNNLISY